MEYAVPADVDGDGRMDLVSVGNAYLGGTDVFNIGLRVHGDPRWAAGRALWNQYEYHHTNIRCDQKLPAHEPPVWQMIGAPMRAGGEVPEAAREALGCAVGNADLTAGYIRVDRSQCPAQADYVVRVGNGGTRSAPPGVAVKFSDAPGSDPVLPLATVVTTRGLLPGEYEDVRLPIISPGAGSRLVVVEADPGSLVADAIPRNNVHSWSVALCDTANRPPVFVSTPPVAAQVGRPFLYWPDVLDPDGDPTTVSLGTGPSNMMMAAGGLFWTPSFEQLGEHLVSLIAEDGQGGRDVQEFVVTVSMPEVVEPLPLPFLEDARLLLSTDRTSYGAGEVVQISTTLANQQPFGRAGVLRIEIFDPTGFVVATVVANQEVLFSGPGEQTTNATFAIGMLPAWDYRVRAVYLEGNHQLVAEESFAVTPSVGLATALGTDRLIYPPNAQVEITRELRNSGLNSALAVKATVEVRDPLGVLVFTAGDASEHLLPAGASERRIEFFTLSPGQPGVYTVRLIVHGGGVELTTREVTFTVSAAAAIVGTMSVEPDPVQMGETLEVVGNFENRGSAAFTGLAIFRILDPDTQTVVVENSMSLGLAAGQTTQLEAAFVNPPLALKTYLASIAVVPATAGAPLLTLAAPFRVVVQAPPTVSIQVAACSGAAVTPVVTITGAGIVSVVKTLDGAPYAGGLVEAEGNHTLQVMVTNSAGATATASANFIVDLTAPLVTIGGIIDGAFVSADVTPVVIVTDANLTSQSASLDGAPFVNGATIGTEGVHVLTGQAADCAGHEASAAVTFTIDKTAPTVSIEVPACGMGPVTPVILVTETHPAQDERLLDGVPYLGGAINSEGAHLIAVSVTDQAGNVTAAQAGFMIDRTAPLISVAGVINGQYVNTPVSPLVLVTDPNLTSSVATLDGLAFSNGTSVGAEGPRALMVQAQDCAGNLAAANLTFTIDTTAPVIAINVPACGHGPLEPAITVTELHPASVLRDLDGVPYLGGPITSEGDHVLVVQATDLAGNLAQLNRTFIIDDTAPVVSITGVVNGGFYGQVVSPAVSFTDVHLTATVLLLDGLPFVSGTTVSAEGPHTMVATAIDCAGNLTTSAVSFVIDVTAPLVTITVPVCGQGALQPLVTVVEDNVASDVRLLDGSPYAGGPIATEGSHTLVVTVTDRAGNRAEVSQTFSIDATAPIITITGVTNGTSYATAVTPFIAISDINLRDSAAQLNGLAFTSGSTINAAGTYLLTVVADDCAGNSTSVALDFSINLDTRIGDLSQSIVADGRILVARETIPSIGGFPSVNTLLDTLNQAGISFEQSFSRAEFLTKLRSGRFNQYIMFQPFENETGSALRELNEAVWMGDGSLFIKDFADAMPQLRESLGLLFQGTVPSLTGVSLIAPLEPWSSVGASGTGVRLKMLTATVAGNSVGSSVHPVAAINSVGLGNAVTLGWNSETSASSPLYLSALAMAAPVVGAALLPGQIVTIQVNVENLTATTAPFVVNHVLDAALVPLEPLTHSLSVAGSATDSFDLRVKLPSGSGSFAVNGTLLSGSLFQDSDTLMLQVPRAEAVIGQDITNALQALVLSGVNVNRRASALSLLAAAAAATDPALAISKTLDAIDAVRDITGVDVTQIRIDLSRLLRVYQMRWVP